MEETSNINGLALTFLAIMSAVILFAKRPRAVAAILVTAVFIPLGQQIIVFGLHLYFMRLLVLVGVTRLILRREFARFKFVTVDKVLIWWVLVGVFCGMLRGPSAETFGIAYDSFGIYFMIRMLTRDPMEIPVHIRVMAWAAIVMACCMAYESMSHENLFCVLGGVPESPLVREGRFRAQGPFRHAILAGTFGATLFPLLVGLWFQERNRSRWLLPAGIVSCLVITVTSASTGPLMCMFASVTGLGLWFMRKRMRLFRRSVVVALIVLALSMHAPFWFLIGRISEIAGGTGWYRSHLIDEAIRHINEWWLIGTSRTAHWGPVENVLGSNPNSTDITNHYLVQGLNGGIIMLGLFLAIITISFKTIGVAARKQSTGLNGRLVWSLGVALMSHCAAFISVSYFDQIKVFWFWLLAAIAAVAAVRKREVVVSRVEAGAPAAETLASGGAGLPGAAGH